MNCSILIGDCLDVLPTLDAESVNTCVTSPPYWGLRDYGVEGQLGLEKTPEEYVAKMVAVFREVRRVLRDDGTVWLNLGDSYAGSSKGQCGVINSPKQLSNKGSYVNEKHMEEENVAIDFVRDRKPVFSGRFGAVNYSDEILKPKDLVGIPWRVAFALQADGWWLRSDIIWAKPNPMPESVTDRPTKAHEYIFLLIATFPPELIEPCVLAGCPEGGVVLDPFAGSGTTGEVAERLGRNSVLIELNPKYKELINERTIQSSIL